MRLLHTAHLEFKEFFDEGIPPYAILSHRWGTVDEEVSFTELKTKMKKTTPGYAKIIDFCELSRQRGFRYCWIDTCCIDKSSSAELTEAINSMYRWYHKARVCFVYLKDVSSTSNLLDSDWFERGWTLQELIAPENVEFLDQDWRHLGSKAALRREIAAGTGIDENVLKGTLHIKNLSVAARMSWAAHRKTSRLEDEAYSLLGLFNVNMPLLYGEGTRAFQRLQEEIYAQTNDDSLFAWDSDPLRRNVIEINDAVLAPSPAAFQNCGQVSQLSRPAVHANDLLFEISRRQLRILVRRTFKPWILQKLLEYKGMEEVREGGVLTLHETPLLLRVPLACMAPHRDPFTGSPGVMSFASLELVHFDGCWYKRGVSWHSEGGITQATGIVDDNDYVRISVHRGTADVRRPLKYSGHKKEKPLKYSAHGKEKMPPLLDLST